MEWKKMERGKHQQQSTSKTEIKGRGEKNEAPCKLNETQQKEKGESVRETDERNKPTDDEETKRGEGEGKNPKNFEKWSAWE